jgi:hypothetical protein
VADPEQVHAALDRWSRELAAGTPGWLGTTAGTAEDGQFVALARFESQDAARRNSDRPEQGQWWTETAKLFTEEVTFRDSSDVTVDVSGDPDKAGFVQVMQGRASDPDRARELMAQDPGEWAAFRPDVIGSVAVGHHSGGYAVAMYFTFVLHLVLHLRAGGSRRRAQRAARCAEGTDGGDEPADGRRAGIHRPQATMAVLTLSSGQSN